MMVFFIPLFGFEIQAQDVHRMILMITVPLFSLRLSATLAYELATYATDIKQLNSTLLVRIGWQNGMFLHNILILFGFLLIILAVIFGMSVSIALPAMGGLILGLYQIWAMRKIAEGRKPIWRSLVLGDFSLYVLIVYLLTYSFWVR
jgi:1,4-dihydroxy-2-naphthoate octaprenyltransferase